MKKIVYGLLCVFITSSFATEFNPGQYVQYNRNCYSCSFPGCNSIKLFYNPSNAKQHVMAAHGRDFWHRAMKKPVVPVTNNYNSTVNVVSNVPPLTLVPQAAVLAADSLPLSGNSQVPEGLVIPIPTIAELRKSNPELFKFEKTT